MKGLFDLFSNKKSKGVALGRLTPIHTIHLPDCVRNLHLRIAGEPETGKTMLAAFVAYQDALGGIPVVVIDGKGQLINALVKLMLASPKREELLARFVYIPFNRNDYAHGLPFLVHSPDLSAFSASQAFIEVVMRVSPTLEEIATTLRQIGTASLMFMFEMGWQITEVLDFLQDKRVRKRVIDAVGERIPSAVLFYRQTYDQWSKEYQRQQRLSFETKVWPYCLAENLKVVVGQSKPTIPFSEIDRNRYIVCLDLSGLDEYPFLLLGTSFIDRFAHYIFKTRGLAKARPVSLIVDEAPELLRYQGMERTFSKFQGVAREYQLWLTICHQNMNQLSPGMRRDLWGIANQIIFRQFEFESALEVIQNLIQSDAKAVKYKAPSEKALPADLEISEQDREYTNWLQRLPNRYCLMRVYRKSWKTQVMKTITLNIDHIPAEMVEAEKLRSLRTFARPIGEVLEEIKERTKEPRQARQRRLKAWGTFSVPS